MTLGLLARCDRGGLASLTREVHRHLHPARTLLVDLADQGRGSCEPDEYAHGNTYRTQYKGALSEDAIEWVTAEGIDTLWSAETFYGGGGARRGPIEDRLLKRAHQQHIMTVCYAMPELSPWAVPGDQSIRPRSLHVPTWWRKDTLDNAILLPFPVARDRLPYRRRDQVTHLYHPTGVAMLDRNGTSILLDSLPFIMSAGLRLTIRTERPVKIPPGTIVDVEVIGYDQMVPDYWDATPADADLLIMPRRYGGLCLPVQECASLGIPAVMLDWDPYADAGFVTAVASTGWRPEDMKGGKIRSNTGVPVHSADPRALAQAIDWLARHPRDVEQASIDADAWATRHSWSGQLGARWKGMLT